MLGPYRVGTGSKPTHLVDIEYAIGYVVTCGGLVGLVTLGLFSYFYLHALAWVSGPGPVLLVAGFDALLLSCTAMSYMCFGCEGRGWYRD